LSKIGHWVLGGVVIAWSRSPNCMPVLFPPATSWSPAYSTRLPLKAAVTLEVFGGSATRRRRSRHPDRAHAFRIGVQAQDSRCEGDLPPGVRRHRDSGPDSGLGVPAHMSSFRVARDSLIYRCCSENTSASSSVRGLLLRLWLTQPPLQVP